MAGGANGARPPGGGPNPPLESLTPEQHRILAYASAIGSEFDFALLLGAMGIEEETLAEEIERLVHLRVFAERAGGERFSFVEEEVRARLYRSLTESRLRVLHRKIGEVLERMYPDPPLPVLTELGRHYFLGKVPGKSHEYNRRAAEAARAAGDLQLAAHHLERVLLDLATLPGDHRNEQAEVDEELGNLEFSLGEYRAADGRFLEALERLGTGSPGTRARILLARAGVALESLEFDSAVALATEAMRQFEDISDRRRSAQAHHVLARIAFRHAACLECLEECMWALDLAGPEADPRFLGSLYIDIGNAFSELGAQVHDEAVEWYQRAIDSLRPAGDLVELARAYLNLGIDVGQSRPQDGIELLEKALQAAEEAHDNREAARAIGTIAEFRLSLGQVEDAERDNEHARHLLEHIPDELGHAWLETNSGLIAERRGLWEEAERAFESALEMCRRNQLPGEEAETAFYLARLRYKTRNLEGARWAFRLASDLGILTVRPDLAVPYHELGELLELLPPEGA
jgi:tetratricopeptide (TPR) repeat protein